MAEESVVCKHHEIIEECHHFAIGTCTLCGQLRRYDRLDDKEPPRIIKIGRINGVPTFSHPPKEVIEVVKNKPDVDRLEKATTDMPHAAAEEVFTPPEPEPVKRKYKTRKTGAPLRDYEADKEAIVEDYDTLSLKEFFAKQHISSAAWTKLKKKWGVKGKHQRKATKSVQDIEVTTVHEGNPMAGLAEALMKVEASCHVASELPDFPEFNDSWPMLTQISWLETYKALKEMES